MGKILWVFYIKRKKNHTQEVSWPLEPPLFAWAGHTCRSPEVRGGLTIWQHPTNGGGCKATLDVKAVIFFKKNNNNN
jgi:hypothetical protein